MEEERRLCFVGMTRARRQLLLTRAVVRTHRGMRAGTIASCFLGELPRESVDFCDRVGDRSLDDIAEHAVSIDTADGFVTEFPVGCIVRHPKFGLGRVEEITPRARGASARVAFPTAGVKTLILEHAPLERVG
jgi:DNA helicase-2/ATP-dependent DNA helicase PcrA